jgi:hypothetical protein
VALNSQQFTELHMADEKEQNRVITYTALPAGNHSFEAAAYFDPEFVRLKKSLEDGWLVVDMIVSPNGGSLGGSTVTVLLVRNSAAPRAYNPVRK